MAVKRIIFLFQLSFELYNVAFEYDVEEVSEALEPFIVNLLPKPK